MASQYTIALIFAMEFEMSAFRYILDAEHPDSPSHQQGGQYICGSVHSHKVVLACLPGTQGKGAAARAATMVSQAFPSIVWYILVGVGGGVPKRHDIRLGDVVVSMPSEAYGGVVQYDLGRMGDGEDWQAKGSMALLPESLRYAVNKMRSNHRVLPNRIEEFVSALLARSPDLEEEYKRPPDTTDILFEDIYAHVDRTRGSDCTSCDLTKVKTRPPRELHRRVRIHYGLIASGDAVVMSTQKRDEIIRRVDGNVLCFEMEAAGIATELLCMVIRGISDYADSHKNKGWQYYAAANAAACAKELLCYADPARVECARGARKDRSASNYTNSKGPAAIVNDQSQNYGIQSTGGSFGTVNFTNSR